MLTDDHHSNAKLQASGDTLPGLSSGQRARITFNANEGQSMGVCPHCNHRVNVGDPICVKCGYILTENGHTLKLSPVITNTLKEKLYSTGEVIATEQSPLTLEINGEPIELPIQPSIVVGRASNNPSDTTPDVDLNPFGAMQQGVSRQHIQITRQGNLLYVADMGSSNGTFLNGRILPRNHKRLIRNGDEIQLGYLYMTVKF
jgi:hypothetical protein